MQLLDKTGMKDIDVAWSLGVSKQILSAWRRGYRSPKRTMIEKIADTFSVDIAWLMGYEDDPEQARMMEVKPKEERLLGYYRELNDTGQELVLQTAMTAVASGMYSLGDRHLENVEGVDT